MSIWWCVWFTKAKSYYQQKNWIHRGVWMKYNSIGPWHSQVSNKLESTRGLITSLYSINTRLWAQSAWLTKFLHSTPDTVWQAVQSCLNNRHKQEHIRMWGINFCFLKAMAVELIITPEPQSLLSVQHGKEGQKYKHLRKRSSKDWYPPDLAFARSRLHIWRVMMGQKKLNGRKRWEPQFIHSLFFVFHYCWRKRFKIEIITCTLLSALF